MTSPSSDAGGPVTAFRPWYALAIVPWLTGCAVGPDYHAPRTVVPAAYAAAQPVAEGGKGAAIDFSRWWQSLKDPVLNALVEQAVKSNLDIEIALDRLQEARTAEAVVLGAALPRVGAGASYGRGTGNTEARGGTVPPLTAATTTRGFDEVNQAAGFDLGWDLDLFGRYRRELEAARDATQAAAAFRNTVLVAVVADVALAYVDMRGLQMQLVIVRKEIATAERSLGFVRVRYERGLTNELDVTLAQRELSTLQSRLGPIAAGIAAAKDSIAVLLGRYPEDYAKAFAAEGVIPPIPGRIDQGLPIDLLRRRPEIREAERQLAAATARIGIATADLYPQVVVGSAIGFQAGKGTDGAALGEHLWSVGPSAYWSLLDFGTLDALVQIADLQTREQLVNYRRTVLNAVRNVDTALARYQAEQESLASLSQAVTASQAAVRLAEERYERGLTDYLNVIDAEREDYALQDQFAAAQQSVADQFVALFRALGGGWEGYQSVPPIRQPLPAILAAAQRLVSRPEPTE